MRQPDWQSDDGSVQLYCGDCLEILPTLEAGSVDAVVTDPPFGIGFRYGEVIEIGHDAESYWRWWGPIYRLCLDAAKPGAFVGVWQTALYFPRFWSWYGDNIHIYAACKNFVQLRKTPINYAFDPVVMHYLPGGKPLRPCKPKRSVDFHVANTASIVSDPTRIEKGHPCPRPLDTVQEIVSNFTLPDGLTLDPCMGSGTTGVACVNTGRRFIGIEIDEGYFDIAVKRIESAIRERDEQLIPA